MNFCHKNSNKSTNSSIRVIAFLRASPANSFRLFRAIFTALKTRGISGRNLENIPFTRAISLINTSS